LWLPLPRGLPVDLVATLDFERLANEGRWTATKRVGRIGKELVTVYLPWRKKSTEQSSEKSSVYGTPAKPGDDLAAFKRLDALGAALDAINKNRDHVMDRGHYFGASLTKQERQDLIDLLKTF
jgi:hypothetical protein